MKSCLFNPIIFLFIVVGCGSTERLAKRMSLFEKEIEDLQKMDQQLNQRLDELQIQISLLIKRISAKPNSSLSPHRLVKIHPKKNKKVVSFSSVNPRKNKSTTYRSAQDVDPKKVDERLPVDPEAARRPLLSKNNLSQNEQDEGSDEETIRNEYFQAYAYYRASELRKAISAFETFSKRYPDHPFAANALFFSGQAKLALGEFKRAQRDFMVLATQKPESRLAGQALLKAGHCDEELGRIKNARNVYLQLIQSYPLSEEAVLANRRLQMIQ